MFLKNKNIIFESRRSKVTDYAALIETCIYIIRMDTKSALVNVVIERMQRIFKYSTYTFKSKLSLDNTLSYARFCFKIEMRFNKCLSFSDIKLPLCM